MTPVGVCFLKRHRNTRNIHTMLKKLLAQLFTVRRAFCMFILNPREIVSSAHWTGILRGSPAHGDGSASLGRVPVRGVFLKLNLGCFREGSQVI